MQTSSLRSCYLGAIYRRSAMSDSGIKITVLLSSLVLGCVACGKMAGNEARGKTAEVKKSVSLEKQPTTEPAPAEDPQPTAEPAPVEEQEPTAEPAPVEDPKSTTEPAPVEDPKPTTEPAPVEDPKPTAEPAPVEEPAKEEPTKEEPAQETPPAEPQPKMPSKARSAPRIIVLDYYKGGKSSVTYTHTDHLKYGGCKTCHHEGMSSCNECHQKSSGETSSLKSIFHDQCKDCHKSHSKKNPESQAPTKCTGCHK